MKINQEKEFNPLTITLETKQECDNFFNIVKEALDKKVKVFVLRKSNVEMAENLFAFEINNL